MTKPTRKTTKAKDKGGRPPVILSAEQLKQAETLAGYGLTIPQISAVIGVAESTLRLRKSDSEMVSSAFTRGRAKAEALVGEALFVRARKGDVQAIKWWEMTRANRREATSAEVTGKDGTALLPGAVTVKIIDPK